MTNSPERMGTDDETLFRNLRLELAQAEAETKRIRTALYATAYRLKMRHGNVDSSRRTGETISNFNYFALKGEALQ